MTLLSSIGTSYSAEIQTRAAVQPFRSQGKTALQLAPVDVACIQPSSTHLPFLSLENLANQRRSLAR